MSTKQFLDYSGLQEVAGNVNTRLKTVSVMPASASEGAIRLYVGATGAYTKGHIYQYQTNAWVDITAIVTSLAASAITYNNTSSGLAATNAQAAIDELNTAIEQIPAGIVPKGTVAFASLPSLASVEVGWMYNISDAFTTTSDFITSGLAVKGNSCVYVANVGTDSAPVLKWNIFANIHLDIEVVAYDDFDPTTIASNKVYLVY